MPPELALLPPTATIFTSMFLHGGFWHLAGNMWFLWIFGNNIEDAMGHVRFVVFYVLCGVAAVFAQVLPHPGSIVPWSAPAARFPACSAPTSCCTPVSACC
jgi:membrane associated rhomboid family serine protease